MSAGPDGDRYSITPPTKPIPRQQATTGSPAAARTPPINAVVFGGERRSDYRSGVWHLSVRESPNEWKCSSYYSVLSYWLVCVFRHTFSTGRVSLLASVRWDALLVEIHGFRGALQWPLLQIKSLLFQHSALPSWQIADLGCVPLCVCVWWCVGSLFLFLSSFLSLYFYPIVWPVHVIKCLCVHPIRTWKSWSGRNKSQNKPQFIFGFNLSLQ